MLTEYPKDKQLTGNAYVVGIMKTCDAKEDEGYQKIILAKPKFCDHVSRCCVECAHEWMQDYNLIFNRTAGGRLLKVELDARGQG